VKNCAGEFLPLPILNKTKKKKKKKKGKTPTIKKKKKKTAPQKNIYKIIQKKKK
jgi:hypothetical protein